MTTSKRPKVRLAFITNASKRKATYKKRIEGLKKKMEELSTLCDVDTCAIISGEFKPEPEIWPSRLDAELVVERFRNVPQVEQARKMHDQVSFSEQRVIKTQLQLNKQLKENREKEMTEVMYDCLAGNVDLEKFVLQDLEDLDWLVDQKMKEINERIQVLKGAGPSQVQGTASNAAEAMAGEPTQPYDGTIASGGTMQLYGMTDGAMAGEPTQPNGGTNPGGETMQLFGVTDAAMVGEPTQPYGNAARVTDVQSTQLFGTTNAAGTTAGQSMQLYGGANAAGEPTQPYDWSSFSQFFVGESSSTANAAGGMAGGSSVLTYQRSTDAARDGGASSSNAAGSGAAGGSTQNQ